MMTALANILLVKNAYVQTTSQRSSLDALFHTQNLAGMFTE